MDEKNKYETENPDEEFEEVDDFEEDIEWDGSENEWVVDDDTESFETQEAGVKIRYVLTKEEVLEALYHSGISKTTGKRSILYTIALVAMGVFSLVAYFFMNQGMNSLVLSIVCFVMIAVVWLVPYFGLKSQARHAADGKEIQMEIYSDEIQMEREGVELLISLDKTSSCKKVSSLVLIKTPEKKVVVLPLRCIEPSVLGEVEAMIISGTKPMEEK